MAEETHEYFKRTIRKGIFLVDFCAPWSTSCRMQTPIIEHLSALFPDKIKMMELNVERCRETAAAMEIRSIPTLILFRDGKEIRRFIGLQPENILCEAIDYLMEQNDKTDRRS